MMSRIYNNENQSSKKRRHGHRRRLLKNQHSSCGATTSSRNVLCTATSVVFWRNLLLYTCLFFLIQQHQEQVTTTIFAAAFAPTTISRPAAPTSSWLSMPKQRQLQQSQQQQAAQQSSSLYLQQQSLSFQRRRRPFGYDDSVVATWGSRRSTQLASSNGGRGGPRRGRPPKKNSSDNDDDMIAPRPPTSSSSDDDVWADVDVDIDILADLEEDEIVAGVDDAIMTTAVGVQKASTTVAAANGDDDDSVVVVEDEYDEDDDALDELDIDDDDDDDEVEIEEESVGELNEDDEGDDEWDEDSEQEEQVEWDPDEDDAVYELEDDLDDPNYMKQKQIVQQAVEQAELQQREESFDALDFVMNEMTPEQAQAMDQLPFIQDVEEQARELMLEIKDFDGMEDLQQEMNKVSDLMDDDPYPRHSPDETNFLEMDAGITDDDMEELDNTYKRIRKKVQEEPWDKVMFKDSMTDAWDKLSQETLDEMEDCLQEIGGSSYNVTRWLLYDLDFNVTNLILAAIQNNPQAPIIFQHWYPQLVTYARYAHVREVLDYDFTLQDVESADSAELERYYAGFGYHQIPTKMPAETGVISLEYMDEEEIKMAAFENWMKDVYNPEWDRKDFDDDDMRDEDNVFSEFYVPPQHPDLPTFEDAMDDLDDWHDEIGHDDDERIKENPEIKEYRDMMGERFVYQVKHDEEFQKEFRGHLVVACTGEDTDLEIAEKITTRFDKEFGKQVYVETRVEAMAREEDNVFEVWLESYEIDLLHSKKRATSNAKGWTGPANCDDKQIDFLVSRVRFLISDDARYSYRLDLDIEAY